MGKNGAENTTNPKGFACVGWMVVVVIVFIAMGYGILYSGMLDKSDTGAGPLVSKIRKVGTAMLVYAVDHDFIYPTGESSTGVFQTLMDEGYLTPEDAANILYLPGMPAKSPYPGTGPLKPENVCFDLINVVSDREHDQMPMIISTGWEITEFEEGAVPQVLNQEQVDYLDFSGFWERPNPSMIIFNKGNSALVYDYDDLKKGALFPKGIKFTPNKTYRQLRP